MSATKSATTSNFCPCCRKYSDRDLVDLSAIDLNTIQYAFACIQCCFDMSLSCRTCKVLRWGQNYGDVVGLKSFHIDGVTGSIKCNECYDARYCRKRPAISLGEGKRRAKLQKVQRNLELTYNVQRMPEEIKEMMLQLALPKPKLRVLNRYWFAKSHECGGVSAQRLGCVPRPDWLGTKLLPSQDMSDRFVPAGQCRFLQRWLDQVKLYEHARDQHESYDALQRLATTLRCVIPARLRACNCPPSSLSGDVVLFDRHDYCDGCHMLEEADRRRCEALISEYDGLPHSDVWGHDYDT